MRRRLFANVIAAVLAIVLASVAMLGARRLGLTDDRSYSLFALVLLLAAVAYSWRGAEQDEAKSQESRVDRPE